MTTFCGFTIKESKLIGEATAIAMPENPKFIWVNGKLVELDGEKAFVTVYSNGDVE
jgi:hypothetical protein